MLDWLLLVLVLMSTLVALMRGFVKEALSLVTWVFAFFIATLFAPGMEVLLEDTIESDEIRQISAFVLLFVATLVVGSLASYLAGQLIKMTGLSLFDRLLGMGFGVVRGVVVTVVLAMVMQLSLQAADAKPDWYADSTLIPHLLLMENWVRDSAGQVAVWLRELGR